MNAALARDQDPEREGDWMQTFTGGRYYPIDPRGNEIEIIDIAHALSMQCRYGGHCLVFYSTAEHSVLLARSTDDDDLARYLLLHDAAEAYCNDMVRPLKRSLPAYKAIEQRNLAVIYRHFGLNLGIEPREVQIRDSRILMDERAQNMRPTEDQWYYGGETEPLGVKLQFWSPQRARTEFMGEFNRLFISWKR